MTLIKSISGIRGTIGGKAGEGLSPADVLKYTAAYLTWVKSNSKNKSYHIIVGRDARISGEMVRDIVTGTATGMGVDITDIGLATTPTVEMTVVDKKADGGIIITASHNPKHWNALKLLNNLGEFLSAEDGQQVLSIAEKNEIKYCNVDELGSLKFNSMALQHHLAEILALPLIDMKAIRKANFKIAIDCVNSVGGIALPALLKALDIHNVVKINCDATGIFQHNPEPLPENLDGLSNLVLKTDADVGFAVDPDVDRLAIICEDGEMFGEEYTLVAVSDYILQNKKGNTVSNLSSTRALRDVTEKLGGKYSASAVGEVNVVEMMKNTNAVIGGEGNGGIIYPDLHYGRDALVGIALFLSYLAKSGKKCSALRDSYPSYYISKNKIELLPEIDVDDVLAKMKEKYKKQPVNIVDGVKIEFDK